jgi:microcompartment protein CcmK/EutM
VSAIDDILIDLAQAQVALRQSSTAFDEAMLHLRELITAIGEANHAQGVAIDAVIKATNEALRVVKGEAH